MWLMLISSGNEPFHLTQLKKRSRAGCHRHTWWHANSKPPAVSLLKLITSMSHHRYPEQSFVQIITLCVRWLAVSYLMGQERVRKGCKRFPLPPSLQCSSEFLIHPAAKNNGIGLWCWQESTRALAYSVTLLPKPTSLCENAFCFKFIGWDSCQFFVSQGLEESEGEEA